MITELRIQNARIYDKRDWTFPFSPLTILCGTNSAGKSTVLKSLLLLRQNLLYRDSSFNLQSGPRLRFSNALTDLGNFRSFVSHNDTQRELHLGVSITARMDPSNYAVLDPTSPRLRQNERDQESVEPLVPTGEHVPYIFDADFYFGVRSSLISIDVPPIDSQLDPRTTEDSEEDSGSGYRAVLKHASFCIRSESGTALVSFDLIGVSLGTFGSGPEYLLRLPRSIFESTELSSFDLLPDPDDESFGLLRAFMPGIYPERVFARSKPGVLAGDDLGPRYWPLPPFIDEAFGDLRTSVNRIFYLGPLRAPAKRYYPIQADASLQNDVSGELLPVLLRDRLHSTVTAAAPGTHEPLRCRLVEALNWWLHYLRTGMTDRPSPIGREIKVDSLQDVLVELNIRSAGGTETHSLADSGFGYSQVLPILVRGLILLSGQTLLVEQPELHLNPALQVRLSDFLVAMSSVGKQIIIETHSEHIVNSIRAITAERHDPHVSDECTVLYLDISDGQPELHRLSVLPDGTIPEWPQSFFGESAQILGRILRAQRKR